MAAYEELLNDAQEARELGDTDLELAILEKADALQAKATPAQSGGGLIGALGNIAAGGIRGAVASGPRFSPRLM